jgi:hypothetical protein
MTDDQIKDLAESLGFVITSLDGYTSTTYYLKKELITIVPRILAKNTLKGYELIFRIFNLNGIVYPTYLSDITDNLEVIEDWYTTNETSITYDTLDQGADFVLFSLPHSIDGENFQLDQGNSIDETTPVIRTDKEVLLPTTTLDELEIFPHLDMIPPLDLLTRHIIIQYDFNFVENETEFMSSNTMLAFYNDLFKMKKATEILYLEPNLKLNTTKDNLLTLETYYNYDKSISTNVESILIGTDFSNIKTINFGVGGYTTVDSSIADVQFPIYSMNFEDFQNKSTNNYELIGRRIIEEKTKFVDFSEIAILDDTDTIIYYAKFPTIRVLKDKVYSNIHLEIKLID